MGQDTPVRTVARRRRFPWVMLAYRCVQLLVVSNIVVVARLSAVVVAFIRVPFVEIAVEHVVYLHDRFITVDTIPLILPTRFSARRRGQRLPQRVPDGS